WGGFRVCTVTVGRSNKLASINDGVESQFCRIDAKPPFREQKVAENEARALKAIGNVEDFRNQFEAVTDVQRSRDHAGVITKGRAEHLPKIALLRFGRHAGRRA